MAARAQLLGRRFHDVRFGTRCALAPSPRFAAPRRHARRRQHDRISRILLRETARRHDDDAAGGGVRIAFPQLDMLYAAAAS